MIAGLLKAVSKARLVVVGVGVTLALCAEAQGLRVAVQLPQIEADSPISEGRRNKFHDILVSGLLDGNSPAFSVVTADELRSAIAAKSELASCQSGRCLQKLADAVQAERLVVPKVNIHKSAIGGNIYEIALTVYDRAGTALNLSSNELCGDENEGCNLSRAFDSFKRATANIAGQVASPQLLSPVSQPSASPTPPTAAPPPAATPDQLTLKSPPPAEQAPTTPSPYGKLYHYGWIGAAALAGVFVATSVPFLIYSAKDGKPNCGQGVPLTQCPTVYSGNTATGLGLLLGGGLFSAGAWAVLFALDKREQKRLHPTRQAQLDPPQLLVGSGTIALSLSGHF